MFDEEEYQRRLRAVLTAKTSRVIPPEVVVSVTLEHDPDGGCNTCGYGAHRGIELSASWMVGRGYHSATYLYDRDEAFGELIRDLANVEDA
jgi:hypothetical protein